METSQKAHPILVTLLKVQRKYGKDYCWPSQKKIIELMDIRQGIKKSRATLNRWLARAQEEKYLLRRRRIKRHPLHGMVFKSSLYKITIKGYRLLQRCGVDMSKEIAAYERWLDEINPERKIVKKKKMLSETEYDPKHKEKMRAIYDQLGKNLAA